MRRAAVAVPAERVQCSFDWRRVTMHHHHQEARSAEQLAIGLGWFSIALGVAELAAPHSLARLIGLPATDRNLSVLRAYGAREVGTGVAILAQPRQAAWLWSRVGGDLLDLASLGAGARLPGADNRRLAAAAGAVAGVTALDVYCANRLNQAADAGLDRPEPFHSERVITINRPVEQVYAYWRNFENFPRFMRNLSSVEVVDSGRSRWRATGPAGIPVEWEAQVVDDVENELIAWRSVEGSAVENRGTVQFRRAPGARGTEVRVRLEYMLPAGALGRSVAWLFGKDPDQQVHEDLRRFKQIMETGEVPLSDGPGLWRAAQPAADPEQIRTRAGVQR
jgi:uncharacterized membrane protein